MTYIYIYICKYNAYMYICICVCVFLKKIYPLMRIAIISIFLT